MQVPGPTGVFRARRHQSPAQTTSSQNHGRQNKAIVNLVAGLNLLYISLMIISH